MSDLALLQTKVKYVRSICSRTADLKRYNASSIEEVLSKFNGHGYRALQCLQLQCIEFDEGFYAELCRANEAYFEQEGFVLDKRPVKRRRVASEDEGEDSDESQQDDSDYESEED